MTTPCTSDAPDASDADARVCPGGKTCENGACRPTASSADSCVAQRYGGHDYLFCTNALTWNTARSRCHDWGFGLAIIDDAAENEFIRSQAASGEWWTAGNDLGVSDIGVQGVDVELRDVSFGSDTASCKKVDGPIGEGTWYWASASANVSNETEFCAITDPKTTTCTATGDRYQNFNPGEPDNAGCTCLGVCLPGEDCLLIRASDGAVVRSQLPSGESVRVRVSVGRRGDRLRRAARGPAAAAGGVSLRPTARRVTARPWLEAVAGPGHDK